MTELKASIQGAMLRVEIISDAQVLGTLYLVPEMVYCNKDGQARACSDLKEAYTWIAG